MKISSFQPMNVYEMRSGQAAAAKPAPKPEEQNVNTASASQPGQAADVLSQEEKQYFAQLYPNETKTISSYSTYSRNGVTKPHSVGSLIDKKS